MSDDILSKYEAEADQNDAKAEKEAAAIRANVNLSDQGKAEAMAKVDAEYARRVYVIQYGAGESLKAELASAEEDLVELRAKAAAKARAEVGAEVAFHLVREEVAAADIEELVPLVEGARDGWERAVYYGLVGAELKRRKRANRNDARVQAAQTKYSTLAAPVDPKVRELEGRIHELRSSDWRLRGLDRRAERERIRQTYGPGAGARAYPVG